MSQKSSVDLFQPPSAKRATKKAIAPSEASSEAILKAALSSLDLQLETEIARYQKLKAEKAADPQIIAPQNQLNPNDQKLAVKETTHLATNNHSQPNSQLRFSPSSISLRKSSSLTHQSDQIEPETLAATSSPQIPLDSYLESSEELLRTLAQKNTTTDKTLADYLFTPLGICSILMVLFGSTFLGLAWLAPHSLKSLGILPAQETANQPTEDPRSGSDSNATDSVDQVELSLETLSNVEPQSRTSDTPPSSPPQTTEAMPSETAASNSQEHEYPNLASALLPRTVQPPDSELTPILKTPNSTSASRSIPTAEIDDYYYVLLPYQNETSLQAAQKVVEDAYLVMFPEGVRIQMGAFNSRKDARKLVKKLQKQEISAFVYPKQ